MLPASSVMAPGRRQFGIKVFEACCSLTQIGATNHTSNQLAPQAQLRPRAFEKCTALRHLNLERTEYDPSNPNQCLPECCFLEAGIVSISLPPDFNWVGPAACERCQQLQIVDLSRTDIPEILGSTFAHCPQLQQLRLFRNLRRIEQEAFLRCASLREVCIPPSLLYIARRAFAGCTQLRTFCKTGKSTTWRGTYARVNAFDKCEHLDKPKWLRFLPPNDKNFLHGYGRYVCREAQVTLFEFDEIAEEIRARETCRQMTKTSGEKTSQKQCARDNSCLATLGLRYELLLLPFDDQTESLFVLITCNFVSPQG